jgi:centromeric protein E
VFIGDLKEEIVLSPQQVMSIIAAGEAHRHVGSTDFNEMSSRSHTIFRMVHRTSLAFHITLFSQL